MTKVVSLNNFPAIIINNRDIFVCVGKKGTRQSRPPVSIVKNSWLRNKDLAVGGSVMAPAF